jgi:SAM-dependent MidA family methyltransferase
MNTLKETIFAALQAAGGVISFARFMDLALYAPGLGYYERPARQTGKAGDFFTSVSVGPCFGRLLAARFAGWLDGLARHNAPPPLLVEAGAHDGRLAADILIALAEHRPGLAVEYWLVEPSPIRQSWQAETLRDFGSRVHWVNDLAAVPQNFRGILFSNELLDAFPAHRLVWDAGTKTWHELGVGRTGDDLCWQRMTLPANLPLPEMPEALRGMLPDGFSTEVCPAAVTWWTAAAQRLGQGRLMTMDYGLEAASFLVPSRAQGTLRAYQRHRQTSDLLACPGQQDLTSMVNFSALTETGEAAGLVTEGLVSQAEFLVAIARDLEKTAHWHWTPELVRQFQTLMHPEHLGRCFRVLIQRR